MPPSSPPCGVGAAGISTIVMTIGWGGYHDCRQGAARLPTDISGIHCTYMYFWSPTLAQESCIIRTAMNLDSVAATGIRKQCGTLSTSHFSAQLWL